MAIQGARAIRADIMVAAVIKAGTMEAEATPAAGAIRADIMVAAVIKAGAMEAEAITAATIGEGVIMGATTEAVWASGSAGLAGTTLITTPILLIITRLRSACRHRRRSTSSGPSVMTIPPGQAYGITALNQNLIILMSRNVRTDGRQFLLIRLTIRGGNAMHRLVILSLLVVVTLFTGCASIPNGPSVMVLPGENKNFDQFRIDDATCRQFAFEQVGGASGQQAAQNSAVTSAVVGTIIGAAAGAAIGSASGDMGDGAAIGAGSGLLLGSAAGTGYASGSYYEAQRRYDIAYMQCMYAKGNQIPEYRRSTTPRPSYYPPPPPGY